MAYLLTAIGVNLCMTFLMRYSEHHDGNRYALNIWNYITGTPYVYGGTTAGVGFDCSGLVQYCHAVAGISLPRTSQAQGGCGIAVSDPQPGDLVCYGSHIGIYIGNGQMIHAPHTGDVVKIASVYGSPWYRRCW